MCTISLFLNGAKIKPCGWAANIVFFCAFYALRNWPRFKCDIYTHHTLKLQQNTTIVCYKCILSWFKQQQERTTSTTHETNCHFWTMASHISPLFHTFKLAQPIIPYPLLVINLCYCATKRDHYMRKFVTYM